MKTQVQVVDAPKYRAYRVVKAHDAVEDYTVYAPAGFTLRWYALALDLAFFAPIDVLIHMPFRRYLEKLQAYGDDVRFIALWVLLAALPLLLYTVAPTLIWGQTLGKRIVGIRVVRSSFNPDLNLWSVLVRETVGKALSLALLGLGFLMVPFNQRRRALHDFMAKTQVISYRER